MFPKFKTRTYILTSLLTILAVSIVIFFITLPEKNTIDEVWDESEELLDDIFNEFSSHEYLSEVRTQHLEDFSGPCGELTRGTQRYAGVRYEITNPDDQADEILLEIDSILTEKGFDATNSNIDISRSVEITRDDDRSRFSNITYVDPESEFVLRVAPNGLSEPIAINASYGCFRILSALAELGRSIKQCVSVSVHCRY